MLGVLAVAGYFSWQQYQRGQRIRSEVKVLEDEAARVQHENESLQERIQYFSTENYREQESKERLNMRRSDEFVVDIEQLRKPTENTVMQSAQVAEGESTTPIYKKWFLKVFR
jgi:cell division protein FtsB